MAPTGMRRRRAHALAATLVQRHLGHRVHRLQWLGGGLTNMVAQCRAGTDEFVVRLNPDAAKVHDFLKEQWAIAQAASVGVPVPTVLEVGNAEDGTAYMISRRVAGLPATHHPDRLAVLRELGRCAALLHGVATSGFGPVFDWSRNRLSRADSWTDYLRDVFDAEGRLHAVRTIGRLPADVADRLAARLREMQRWRKPAVLHHGDLRLKNTLVDEGGRLTALIDWENCASSPAGFWDLSIALHDLGPDGKEAFLQGYGLTPAAFSKMAPYVQLLNLLNYAGVLRQAAAERDIARLAWLRVRLRGGFDMAALA